MEALFLRHFKGLDYFGGANIYSRVKIFGLRAYENKKN